MSERAPHHDLAVRLHRQGIDICITDRSWVKHWIQPARRINPGQALARFTTHLGEGSAHSDPGIPTIERNVRTDLIRCSRQCRIVVDPHIGLPVLPAVVRPREINIPVIDPAVAPVLPDRIQVALAIAGQSGLDLVDVVGMGGRRWRVIDLHVGPIDARRGGGFLVRFVKNARVDDPFRMGNIQTGGQAHLKVLVALVDHLVRGQDLDMHRAKDVVVLVRFGHMAVGVHLGVEGIDLDIVKDVGRFQDIRPAGRHPPRLAGPFGHAILPQLDRHHRRVHVQVGPEVIPGGEVPLAGVGDRHPDRHLLPQVGLGRLQFDVGHDQVGVGRDLGRGRDLLGREQPIGDRGWPRILDRLAGLGLSQACAHRQR